MSDGGHGPLVKRYDDWIRICFVMLKCKPEQSVKTQEGGQMKDFPVIGL